MEEKGYWFSLENGTHIHAEEGESPKEATQKKLKSFKNPKNAKTEQTSLKEGVNKLVEESKEEPKKTTVEEQRQMTQGWIKEIKENNNKITPDMRDKIIKQLKSNYDLTDEEAYNSYIDWKNSLDFVEDSKAEEPKEQNDEVKKTTNEIMDSGNDYASQMLGRLRSDVEYILGSVADTRKNNPDWFVNNDRNGDLTHLWYNGDIDKHIGLMKNLVKELNKKGVKTKLSLEDVNNYEKQLRDYVSGK